MKRVIIAAALVLVAADAAPAQVYQYFRKGPCENGRCPVAPQYVVPNPPAVVGAAPPATTLYYTTPDCPGGACRVAPQPAAGDPYVTVNPTVQIGLVNIGGGAGLLSRTRAAEAGWYPGKKLDQLLGPDRPRLIQRKDRGCR